MILDDFLNANTTLNIDIAEKLYGKWASRKFNWSTF